MKFLPPAPLVDGLAAKPIFAAGAETGELAGLFAELDAHNLKEPRQCIKCQRWFYDSIFYREGFYGCRWHDCDRINHVTRTVEFRPRRSTLLEAIAALLGGTK